MCLIVHSPAGVSFPFDVVADAWRANPDGAGYAFTDDVGRMQALKGIMSLRDLETFLEAAPTLETDFTLHFRWMTSGKRDKGNTHPWIYNGDTAVIHNGVFNHVRPTKTTSDTGIWTASYIGKLVDAGALHAAHEAGAIAANIGAGNKVVIHHRGARPFIVNAESGEWVEGNWFSNLWFDGRYGFGDDDAAETSCSSSAYSYGRDGAAWRSFGDDADYVNQWELKDAAELLEQFANNDGTYSDGLPMGEYTLSALADYLDRAAEVFPGLPDAIVSDLKYEVEWSLFHLDARMKEYRGAKPAAPARRKRRRKSKA